MNLANKLTVFRIILVIVILIISISGIAGEICTESFGEEDGTTLGISINLLVIDIIFIIASITDKLDGYIARSRNQITTFGKFLDPLADKILVIVSMIILVEVGKLPAWIPSIVIFREFIVSGYRLLAVEKGGQVIAASIWGKLKTVTQMIAIIFAFIDPFKFGAFLKGINNFTTLGLTINVITTVLMFISIIATVFSGWDYMKNGKNLF